MAAKSPIKRTRKQEMRHLLYLERKVIEKQLSAIPKFGDLEVLHRHRSSPPQIIFSVWKGNDPAGNNEELILERAAVTSLFTWKDGKPTCPDGLFYEKYKDWILEFVSDARTYLEQAAREQSLSFSDKLDIAYGLAERLCYVSSPPGKHLSTTRDTAELFGEPVSSRLWAYVDGLMDKYHDSRATGACSLAASVAYDPEAEEKRLDADIDLFRILKVSLEGIDDSIPSPSWPVESPDMAASPGT